MTIADDARAGSSDFPMTWEDPADPERSWERDDMHMPFALTPLAQDYIRALGSGFKAPHETFGGFPQRTLTRIWNGYVYFGDDPGLPESERAGNLERWRAVMRARAQVSERYWADEVLPEVRAIEARLRQVAIETLPPAELATAWDDAWTAMERLWALHFCLILGPYQVTEDLVELYGTVVPDAGSGEALRLIQGSRHELLETELGVERLTGIAGEHPAIAARLASSGAGVDQPGPPVQPVDLQGLPGGPVFLGEFMAFLERHGHLGQPFDDLHLPSWAEEPGIVLAELGRRLVNPPEPAETRRERLAADANLLADSVRAKLAGRPDDLARFEELLALARAIGPLTEVHNYWIDRMAQARMRVFASRVGTRLVTTGCVVTPDDVFFLHRPEVRDLVLRPADVAVLVGERRTAHARQATIVPPSNLGAAPPPSNPDLFGGPRIASHDPSVLRGTGASAGIVRGPARVAVGPADFGRIRAGDIIVCPSSNPSWVAVFTVAAGLVTNTGGILSHAAVVAREFGLPAVVGTGDATTRIADGRLVEIDGTQGTVHLL